MSTQEPVFVSLEFTPNPNTLKYSVNRTLLVTKSLANYTSKEKAEASSPLAAKLFNVPGIEAVMIAKDFVTVTKTELGDWDIVHKGASQEIENHLSTGEPAVIEENFHTETHGKSNSDVTTKIIEILDQEVRPAVAMDGGDITFDRYEDGVVYLHMQGSCAGCPSSTATLKQGIETRLRDAIPEIVEVVAV